LLLFLHPNLIGFSIVFPIFSRVVMRQVTIVINGRKCYRAMHFHASKKKAFLIANQVERIYIIFWNKVAYTTRWICLLLSVDENQRLMLYCGIVGWFKIVINQSTIEFA